MPEEAPAEATTPEPAQAPEEKDWRSEYESLKSETRKWEQRAKENKAAAEKLAEMEEAQKTAEQKAAERLAEAERRAAELEAKAARAEIAASSGIPVSLLAGPEATTPDAVQAYADALRAWQKDEAAPRTPAPDPGQGPRQATPEADFEAEYRKYYPDQRK